MGRLKLEERCRGGGSWLLRSSLSCTTTTQLEATTAGNHSTATFRSKNAERAVGRSGSRSGSGIPPRAWWNTAKRSSAETVLRWAGEGNLCGQRDLIPPQKHHLDCKLLPRPVVCSLRYARRASHASLQRPPPAIPISCCQSHD